MQFPVTFLAKRAERLLRAQADRLIGAVIRASAILGALPARCLTGRYLALRIVKRA